MSFSSTSSVHSDPVLALTTEIRRHTESEPWTYSHADAFQKKILQELVSGKRDRGVLLFSEVAPVITLGKRRTSEDLLLSRADYAEKGIELLEIDRGGRATYHGPGQWVIFAIDTLERLTGDRKGVRKVTCMLLDSVRDAVQEKYPDVQIRQDDQVGIWESSSPHARKIASIGIQIKDGILQHGIAVNIFETPESFYGIHPCGIGGAKPGFLESEKSERALMDWKQKLEKAFRAGFQAG